MHSFSTFDEIFAIATAPPATQAATLAEALHQQERCVAFKRHLVTRQAGTRWSGHAHEALKEAERVLRMLLEHDETSYKAAFEQQSVREHVP